jgi:hypothetical protein
MKEKLFQHSDACYCGRRFEVDAPVDVGRSSEVGFLLMDLDARGGDLGRSVADSLSTRYAPARATPRVIISAVKK